MEEPRSMAPPDDGGQPSKTHDISANGWRAISTEGFAAMNAARPAEHRIKARMPWSADTRERFEQAPEDSQELASYRGASFASIRSYTALQRRSCDQPQRDPE